MYLVTGASGFVGRHLVHYLSARGLPVRALYNSTPPSGRLLHLPGVEWRQCDLLDIFDVEDALKGISHIYHCAAVVSFQSRDKKQLLHNNITITAHIVNEALEQNIEKLVYVSSIASLGRGENNKTIDEAAVWEESTHNSAYSKSKYYAEMEVWRGMGEGLSAAIVNPGVILGATHNWDEGSARLMKVVDSGFPFYTEGVNGWVSVDDLVKSLVLLMDSPVDAERYVLVQGNYSYLEMFTKMAHALGVRPPRIKASAFMSGLVWRWNALRSFLFGSAVSVTKETARTANQKCYYNNEKFLKAFPAFSYEDMDLSVKKMAEAYKINI